MPQFQSIRKDQARVKILSKDATRAYLLLMRETGGKMQVLPGDTFVLEEPLLAKLDENGIGYERIDKK